MNKNNNYKNKPELEAEIKKKMLEDLNASMINHKPSEDQIRRIESLRDDFKKAGTSLIELCPVSNNLAVAITTLEEALHRGVKAIILEDK